MTTDVRDNPGESRYEIFVDDSLAGFTDYHDRDGVLVFPHTEVFAGFEGQGIGSRLVRGALDDVRVKGRTIEAQCPYVASWVEKHPDYAELIA